MGIRYRLVVIPRVWLSLVQTGASEPRASFSSLFAWKGRTLDHRRSEQQQAPVAESLRLPPVDHGGE